MAEMCISAHFFALGHLPNLASRRSPSWARPSQPYSNGNLQGRALWLGGGWYHLATVKLVALMSQL